MRRLWFTIPARYHSMCFTTLLNEKVVFYSMRRLWFTILKMGPQFLLSWRTTSSCTSKDFFKHLQIFYKIFKVPLNYYCTGQIGSHNLKLHYNLPTYFHCFVCIITTSNTPPLVLLLSLSPCFCRPPYLSI